MVRERSKGCYCFFEYADPSVTDQAIQGLPGQKNGGKKKKEKKEKPKYHIQLLKCICRESHHCAAVVSGGQRGGKIAGKSG
jgi:hypothetical protein